MGALYLLGLWGDIKLGTQAKDNSPWKMQQAKRDWGMHIIYCKQSMSII